MPIQEKVKSTLTVDENDILSLSQKIQKNLEEDKAFAESFDKFISNTEKTTEPLIVGSTPNALAIAGANPDLDVIIAPRTITKCMAESDEQYHGHGLSAEIMKQLPEQLRNPAMIFKGNKDNSLVAITELKDKENREIMIAVNLNEVSGRQEANRISSAYGRNNMIIFLKSQMEQGNLIACNKEKANEMFQSAGLQLPLEETFISFDNSIAYSTENVNTISAKDLKENVKKLLPFLNAKYRWHISQIVDFNEKKSTCIDKINYRQDKIEKLTAKSERLTQTNRFLKSRFENTIFANMINSYIQSKEEKIRQIREERIPKHSQKIYIQNAKIKSLDHKIEVKQCKADKLYHLNNLIKSFGILNGEKRHKQFTTALDGLNNASQRSVQFKLEKCNSNINKLNEKYLNTESSTSKLDISHKLNDLKTRQTELSNKLKKLQKVSSSISKPSPETVEKLMDKTENQFNTAIHDENLNVSDLADNISINNAEYLTIAEKSIESKESEVSHQEEQSTAKDNVRKPYEKINSDYYESLKKNDRYTKKMNDNIADFLMQQLKDRDIKFSAVRLANNITGVTVHKDNQESFDEAINLAKYLKGREISNEKIDYSISLFEKSPMSDMALGVFSNHIKPEYSNEQIAEIYNKVAEIYEQTELERMKDEQGLFEQLNQLCKKFDYIIQLNELTQTPYGNFNEEQKDALFNALNADIPITVLNELDESYSAEEIHEFIDIYKTYDMDKIDGFFKDHSNKHRNYDRNLRQLTNLFNFNEEQKNALFNAIKADIPTELLCKLNESYSADEINKFIDVYKTNDMDKIDDFFKDHKKGQDLQQQKKELTFSRNQMKVNAEKISKEKNTPKQKTIEHAI